jgi:hypothetical protein
MGIRLVERLAHERLGIAAEVYVLFALTRFIIVTCFWLAIPTIFADVITQDIINLLVSLRPLLERCDVIVHIE